MEMTGSESIAATPAAVYAALNDAEVLMQALPGCKELHKTSDTEFDAVIVLKVGPIKATFKLAGILSDLNPPHGYTISGEGKGGVAGFAKGHSTVQLVPAEEGGTTLNYAVTVDIGGKLAQLGARLINATAMKFAGTFFANLNKILSGESIQPGVEEGASS